jgi:hypothetical protein
MRVEVSEKSGEMKFKFHLDRDDGVSSTNFRMASDSVTFQVPDNLGRMIHPDLVALTTILCCHPFVGKELHLPTPVSKEFLSEARRVITRYSLIGETSEKISRREPPENSRPGLAFSGGVDSTAALSVMPPITVPIFMKRPKKKGSLYDYSAALESCDLLSQIGFDVQILVSDLEYVRDPVGFPTDLAHAAPAVLLSDYLGLDSISFGTVLESAYGIGHESYRNYPKMSHWRFFGTLFSAAGIPICLPVAGISEVGTSIIVERSPLGHVAQSCIRGAWKSPCWNCWKCFRKGILGSALGINEIGKINMENMLNSVEIKMKLSQIPISHENVISYALERANLSEQKELMELYEVVRNNAPLGLLERWYSPSISLISQRWKKVVRNNILRLLAPMTKEDEEVVENWSLLEKEEEITHRKDMIEELSIFS